MSELKVCRICLRTEAKMYHFHLYQLKFYYEEVMAVQLNEQDGLPQYFCYECATILHKFHKFKEKCFSGQKILRELAWRGPITYESIYKVDRDNKMLISPITVITLTERVKTYITKDSIEDELFVPEKKVEKIENIELDYFSETSMTGDQDPMLDFNDVKIIEDMQVEFDQDNIKVDIEKSHIDQLSPSAVYVEGEKGILALKCEEIKPKKKVRMGKFCGKKILDSNHWKRISLSEEEAVKNFRARAKAKKYVNAAYKCTDCLKGFSKKDMLDRHTQLKHVKELGPYECRLCRMRYKLNCYLKKHMREHYFKYECLRCHLICPLENTALIHDESHSGITRKCDYCDEEFRHSSTYYTHLRTHRSEHVCSLCGASFVSKAGLHQHKKLKHVIVEIDSPDDDEEVNTFCQRCDIRFETRKAYVEHLFHSAHHIEGDSEYMRETNRKILGKKQQEKITKRLTRSATEDVFIQDNKKKRKYRRHPRKPTTCHQCGKHFDTQAACWKHHLSEHPRTSFYGPGERYICEICGSSLAPGSIKTHKNMHTRETLHTCDTCGKQFHAPAGLRRHLLTHTGEKPYACSLCDKRFTQSNSMKLHYRTFHLKEPYPKRNRRKNKDEPKTADVEDSNSDEDSDSSLPDIEPELPEPDAGVKPVPDVMPDKQCDESMHYLTLT